jgi:hypothetical protein
LDDRCSKGGTSRVSLKRMGWARGWAEERVSARGCKMEDRGSWREVGESCSEDVKVRLRSDGN